jgi:hypothetical protein
MKPVVSSLVALAIAIAPLSAMAKPAHNNRTSHAKVVKHKVDKAEKSDKAERSDKCDKDKGEKSPMIRVKAGKRDGAAIKNVHHAHNVDLGGSGHNEPSTDRRGALVTASMKAPAAHGKSTTKSPSTKASEMPRLPNPNAGKPSKGGAERGARKPAGKKAVSNDDSSGEPTRDEEIADLVARIRGHRTPSSDHHDGGAQEASQDEVATLVGSSRGSAEGGTRGKNEDGGRDAKVVKNASHSTSKAPCTKEPVEIIRGPEVERFALTKCDGTVAPLAIEHLSILIRPGGAARPTAPIAELAKKPGAEIAHGVRRVDPRLVERIQAVADHFGKDGAPAKLFVISGYRPASVGSMHSSGRAIDLLVDGAKNEYVVAFCKTLGDTGCGYYPNSSFVHLDVRDSGAGHVSWIDASGPGETPRYVSTWPPPSGSTRHLHRASATQSASDLAEEGESLLRARRPLDRDGAGPEPVDEHPAETAQ